MIISNLIIKVTQNVELSYAVSIAIALDSIKSIYTMDVRVNSSLINSSR